MAVWNPFRREKRETLEDILIRAGLVTSDVTKEQALGIPAVSACVSLITDTVASLPIVLYKGTGAETKIVENDDRVALLNDDTKDSLDGFQFKQAMCTDYLLNGSGYAYIERQRNTVKSLHYVDHIHVTTIVGSDPIYKAYQIQVNGALYRDFQFLKLLRKTKDGVTGKGIIQESNKILSVVHNSLIFEETLVKSGGGKKGFLKSQGRLSETALTELKKAWKDLYGNSHENILVLNQGLEFQEATNTSVEMQLNEQKMTNSAEIGKIFLVPANILDGTATDEEYANWIKMCIVPIVTAFECALNRDLLLPSEKESMYFAFDLTEILRADIVKRYTAYDIAVNSGILQIDEVRYKENLPPLNLKWLRLGLQDVLYFPESDEIYTPNTNKLAKMGEDGTPDEEMGAIHEDSGENPPKPDDKEDLA